ncbi:hypothetical protein IWZ01DRAFT_486991 [Phyllosticta capitalensis]
MASPELKPSTDERTDRGERAQSKNAEEYDRKKRAQSRIAEDFDRIKKAETKKVLRDAYDRSRNKEKRNFLRSEPQVEQYRWDEMHTPRPIEIGKVAKDAGNMMEQLSRKCFDVENNRTLSPQSSHVTMDDPCSPGGHASGISSEALLIHAFFVVDWQVFNNFHGSATQLPEDTLATATTITGSLRSAAVTTTAEYLKQNWPNSTAVLRAIWESIGGASNDKNRARFSDQPHIEMKIRAGQTLVSICGKGDFIKETVDQLSWIGSALRNSPSGSVAQCSPFFSHLERFDPDSAPKEHNWAAYGFSRDTWDIYGRVSFRMEVAPEQDLLKLQEGTCWHGLFRNPIIAHGHPQSSVEGELGLEIPLDMMARSIGTSRAIEFQGGLLLKGFSAILLPTRLVNGTLTWHLVSNEDGTHISFLDERVRKIQRHQRSKITLADLPSVTKHVVGWCPTAKSFAGHPNANYPVLPSGCPEKVSGVRVEKFSISAGQYITGSATISPGERAAPMFRNQATDPYEMNVLFIAEKPVLLYDVGEQRGWLVNGATAVLHLVIATWKYLLSTEVESKILSKVKNLSLDQFLSARSAVKILLCEENTGLPLLPGQNEGEKYTFRQEVERAMLLMEQAFAYQELEQYKPGFELKIPFVKNRLAGFDFAELAKPASSPKRRAAELRVASRGWVKVIKRSKAVVLFGKDFGDLIKPADPQCDAWSSVPAGDGYIASRIEDLDWIKSDVEIMNEFVWNKPGQLFKCCCKSQSTCNRALALLPISLWSRSKQNHFCVDTLSGDKDGAIVLGWKKD